MHTNQAARERFYKLSAHLDVVDMATCYAEDGQFDDEAFSMAGLVAKVQNPRRW